MANLVGTTLGQYKITALIGEGGMADVYRARQESLKRDVAVKVMRLQLSLNPEFLKRFQREAQTIAGLNHPHIIRIFDYGEQQDITYLVMDYLTGGSLGDMIKRERSLDPKDASIILDQIASALDHAHRRGIIHRDLKPHNILFDESGSAMLTDFGIAKLMNDTSIHTQTGVAIGTPAYMAPEQWQGLPVDARTDVYALGIILYEMLTGHVPYTGTSPVTVMHRALTDQPRPLSTYRTDLSDAVEEVIRKVLAKTQDARYQTAGEFAAAFRLALTAPRSVTAAPTNVVAYNDDHTVDLGRQTPPSQPPVRTPVDQQNFRRKTEQDFPFPSVNNTPAPSTQASKTRSRGLMTAIGAILALVLLGGAGALLLPRFLNAPMPTETSVALLPSATSAPQGTPTITLTPSPSVTDTATTTPLPTDTPTATTDPLRFTETARAVSILQTIDAFSTQTMQAFTQTAESATQTAISVNATENALKNQREIEQTVAAFIQQTSDAFAAAQTGTVQAIAQTGTAQAILDLVAATSTAAFLAPTLTQEAVLTSQAAATSTVIAQQTATVQANSSTATAIAEAVIGTQTAIALIPTQTAQAKSGNTNATRTAAAATADLALTHRAATFDAMLNAGKSTPIPIATQADSVYAEHMVSLIEAGALTTMKGKIDFKLASHDVKVNIKNQIQWDQWTSSYTDFVWGAEFTFGTNDNTNACGLMARIVDRTFYAFEVTRGGQFRFQMLLNNEWQSSKTKSANATINASGTNTIVVVAQGSTYKVVINDRLVGTYTDAALTSGNVGAFVSSGPDAPNADCNYTNLWAWNLNANGALLSADTVEVTDKNTIRWRPISESNYADFVISAQVTWTDNGTKDGCGYVFRKDTDNQNYYAVTARRSKIAYLEEYTNGAWVDNAPSARISDLNANDGGKNEMVLVAKGGLFTLYINGKLVLDHQDSTLSTGLLSLAAIHFDQGNQASCVFEDVWVWTLDN